MEKKELIFGRNPVLEYLKKSTSNDKAVVFISKNSHGKIIDTIASLALQKKIRVEYKDKDFFSKLGPSSSHQGIALRLTSQNIEADERDVLDYVAQKNGILILLDQITDPHNAGSIIRTSEAFGCDAVILPKSNSVGINQTVIKSSAGATAHIKIITISNVASFLELAKEKGFWIVGSSDHGTHDLEKLNEIKPAIIIIGSEGKGMRKLTEEKCDIIIRIPMKGRISSLNASVAAGILIYEAAR